MKQHQRPEGISDEHLTPRHIWEPLGKFDLDPCCSIVRPWDIATTCYTIADNGLEQPWRGRVWCNPPFNRYQRPLWMEYMARHQSGILLVPAATETAAFKEFVFEGATAVCFLNHRPHFCDVNGVAQKANCGCSIALAAYSDYDADILHASKLGKTFDL